MAVGLSKAILPICKPTSRVMIWESNQSRIYCLCMTLIVKSGKERICAIDQGFTYLAAQTTQSLALEGLGDGPTLT
jgi:hypothetical protein